MKKKKSILMELIVRENYKNFLLGKLRKSLIKYKS